MPKFPLSDCGLDAAGLRPDQIARLIAMIEAHIAEGRYPGAQIAIARHGQIALSQTFGDATLGTKATDDTLWLLYSTTKVITAAATWILAEQGAFSLPTCTPPPTSARRWNMAACGASGSLWS